MFLGNYYLSLYISSLVNLKVNLIAQLVYQYFTGILAVADAPSNVEACDISKTQATITWQAPANDGGTPITGYFVERSTNSSERWIRQTRDAVTDTIYTADNLMEGTEYLYRIIAVNKRGESSPSTPSDRFTAKNPYGKFA